MTYMGGVLAVIWKMRRDREEAERKREAAAPRLPWACMRSAERPSPDTLTEYPTASPDEVEQIKWDCGCREWRLFWRTDAGLIGYKHIENDCYGVRRP